MGRGYTVTLSSRLFPHFPFSFSILGFMLYGRGGCWIASAVLFLCCSLLFFVTVVLLVVLWPSIHIAY
jgi:hypothetical protein